MMEFVIQMSNSWLAESKKVEIGTLEGLLAVLEHFDSPAILRKLPAGRLDTGDPALVWEIVLDEDLEQDYTTLRA